MQQSFFSLAELKQPVNQWLCIAFISLLCFWTVLFYAVEKTKSVAEAYVSDSSSSYSYN